MDLYSFASHYKISLAKVRRMDKAGHLRLDPIDELTGQARDYLRRGQPLTLPLLVELVENPAKIDQLGQYADKARDQIAELSLSDQEPMPNVLMAEADLMATGDAQAIGYLVEWIQSIIPERGSVSHYFLAVRLMLASVPAARAANLARIPRALLNARKAEAFAGWYHVEKIKGRSVTRYHRPNSFDL